MTNCVYFTVECDFKLQVGRDYFTNCSKVDIGFITHIGDLETLNKQPEKRDLPTNAYENVHLHNFDKCIKFFLINVDNTHTKISEFVGLFLQLERISKLFL